VAERIVEASGCRSSRNGRIRRRGPVSKVAEGAYRRIPRVRGCMDIGTAGHPREGMGRIDPHAMAAGGVQACLERKSSGEVVPVADLAIAETGCSCWSCLCGCAMRCGKRPSCGVSHDTMTKRVVEASGCSGSIERRGLNRRIGAVGVAVSANRCIAGVGVRVRPRSSAPGFRRVGRVNARAMTTGCIQTGPGRKAAGKVISMAEPACAES
jgi:hypothetical protein